MKHLKLWESFNETGDFYSKYWLDSLSESFGHTKVDKFNSIQPLYGGGTFSQIGYKCELTNDDNFSSIILEGITNNGVFITSSIIVFDKGGDAISHGSIKTDSIKTDTHSENIVKTIDSIKEYLNRYRSES